MQSVRFPFPFTACLAVLALAFCHRSLAFPDIMVSWAQPTFGPGMIQDGGVVLRPMSVAGGTASFSFNIENFGPDQETLQLLAVTFDGPDAAEFTVSTPLPLSVEPGNRMTLTVQQHSVTGGRKNAAMHLASNVSGSRNPFDLSFRMVPGYADTDANIFIGLGPVYSMAMQGNGSLMVSSETPGLNRFSADLQPDGFTAPEFSLGGGFPGFGRALSCIAVQKDGRILLAGPFDHVGGLLRQGVVRLMENGTVDASFVPALPVPGVTCLAVQPDGKILAGGNLFVAGGAQRNLVRLLPNGALDATFNVVPDGPVACLALQPDGKIIAGGQFTKMNTTAAAGIARLLPDGTPEALSAAIPGTVVCLALQADGRILAGGDFPGWLRRLLPDGSFDPAPLPVPDGPVQSFALQADGHCFLAGAFTSLNGVMHRGLGRMLPDGSLDDAFYPDAGPGGGLGGKLLLQSDGKLLFNGMVPDINGMPHAWLSRVQNDAAFSFLRSVGSTTVRWLRSGTAPEGYDVTLDLQSAGSANWVPLGTAHRVAGGWELSGLSLPKTGTLRARALAGGSVIESTMPLMTSLEYWRLQNFNVYTSSGNAADNADPDHDGLENLVEYAFGLPPLNGTTGALPRFSRQGSALTSSFTSTPETAGVSYGAEWSTSLDSGAWSAIPDTGTGGVHTFSIPAQNNRVFVRLVVRRE